MVVDFLGFWVLGFVGFVVGDLIYVILVVCGCIDMK